MRTNRLVFHKSKTLVIHCTKLGNSELMLVVYIAKRFGKTSGVVFKLGAEQEEDSDSDNVPRYVPVQDISAFSDEKEYLFSGQNNKFIVEDIYDCSTRTWHKHEIAALRKFQQMLRSDNSKWDKDKNEISIVQEYIRLVLAEYVSSAALSSMRIDKLYADLFLAHTLKYAVTPTLSGMSVVSDWSRWNIFVSTLN